MRYVIGAVVLAILAAAAWAVAGTPALDGTREIEDDGDVLIRYQGSWSKGDLRFSDPALGCNRVLDLGLGFFVAVHLTSLHPIEQTSLSVGDGPWRTVTAWQTRGLWGATDVTMEDIEQIAAGEAIELVVRTRADEDSRFKLRVPRDDARYMLANCPRGAADPPTD